MLLSISMMSFANENEYMFIKQATDGRFYMEENTVIELANYIKQLKELNNNYLAQIENLKKQIANLEKQISNLEEQVAILSDEKRKLEHLLKAEKLKSWTVVAVIVLGATAIFFIK